MRASDIPSASPRRGDAFPVGEPTGVGSPNRYRRALHSGNDADAGGGVAPGSPALDGRGSSGWGVAPSARSSQPTVATPSPVRRRSSAPRPAAKEPDAEQADESAITSTAEYKYGAKQAQRPAWLLRATGYAPPPVHGRQRVEVGPAAVARALLMRERCSLATVLPDDEAERREVIRELAAGGADAAGNASNPDPLRQVFRAVENEAALAHGGAPAAPPLDEPVSRVFRERRSSSPTARGSAEYHAMGGSATDDPRASSLEQRQRAIAAAERAARQETTEWSQRIGTLAWLNREAREHPSFDASMLSLLAATPGTAPPRSGGKHSSVEDAADYGVYDPRTRFAPSASVKAPTEASSPFPRAGASASPAPRDRADDRSETSDGPRPEWIRRATVPFAVHMAREREAVRRATQAGGRVDTATLDDVLGDGAGAESQVGMGTGVIDRHRLVKLHDAQVAPPPPQAYTHQPEKPLPLPFDRPSPSRRSASPLAIEGVTATAEPGTDLVTGGTVALSHRPLKPHEKRANMFVELSSNQPGADVIRRMHPSLDGRVDTEKMAAWIRSTTTTTPFNAVAHGAPGAEVQGMGGGRDTVTPHKVQHAKIADSAAAARRVTWDLGHE